MQPGRGKAKGNKYEIKVSREMSQWMFNDPNLLWKDSTSGGRKKIYRGDIVPAKAHEFPWNIWPFLFEVKNGYKDHIPTLMNQNKLREWLIKLLKELDTCQYIPILISQFHRQTPIFITTLMLNFYCDVSLIQMYNNTYYTFYVYNYRNLITYDFFETLPEELKTHIQTSSRNEFSTIPKQKKPHHKKKQSADVSDVLGEILS